MPLPKIAIASLNLGRASAGHKLRAKFEAAATAGFEGIELAYDCLLHHAKSLSTQASIRDWEHSEADALRLAAKDARKIADELKLDIMALEPLMGYDGIIDWQPKFAQGVLWIELCKILGAKILQLPTCTYPVKPEEINTSPSHIASNVQRLADACLDSGITLAYEATAWGMTATTWQKIQNVIFLADRPNVKHCLDTYHIAAIVSGHVNSPQTGFLKKNSTQLIKNDMGELKKCIKKGDIGYFQLSDAQGVDLEQKGYPLVDLNQPDNMTWSRNCRNYPMEDGVLQVPVLEICKAVFAIGYRGWVSLETFHAELYDQSPSVPTEQAERGMRSWKKIVELCEAELK